jgi:hypothetical protein
VILLTSPSQIARITGMSHCHLAGTGNSWSFCVSGFCGCYVEERLERMSLKVERSSGWLVSNLHGEFCLSPPHDLMMVTDFFFFFLYRSDGKAFTNCSLSLMGGLACFIPTLHLPYEDVTAHSPGRLTPEKSPGLDPSPHNLTSCLYLSSGGHSPMTFCI